MQHSFVAASPLSSSSLSSSVAVAVIDRVTLEKEDARFCRERVLLLESATANTRAKMSQATTLLGLLPCDYRRLLRVLMLCLCLALTKLYYRVLFLVPSVKQRMIAAIGEKTHMNESSLKTEDWQDTLNTWQAFTTTCHMFIQDLYTKVKHDSVAYDADVVSLDGTPRKLLDFASQDRPLVVNFGSCT
ncbi:hypothetical protein LSAT2_026319 [Lamellibrachia satsuma]|nr:hypothetical protein LSAT2_026319 [Lamellibrachia satsuma]